MNKYKRLAAVTLLVLACTGCGTTSSEESSEISDNTVKIQILKEQNTEEQNTEEIVATQDASEMDANDYVVNGSEVYHGFVVDSVLYSESEGEIHYCVYVALMCSSQWDGGYDALVKARTPVYFAIGESDEYYGSKPFQEAYHEIYNLYYEQGLTEQEIGQLLVLDIKDEEYFTAGEIKNQHGGGAALFCKDSNIMGWLFQR